MYPTPLRFFLGVEHFLSNWKQLLREDMESQQDGTASPLFYLYHFVSALYIVYVFVYVYVCVYIGR